MKTEKRFLRCFESELRICITYSLNYAVGTPSTTAWKGNVKGLFH